LDGGERRVDVTRIAEDRGDFASLLTEDGESAKSLRIDRWKLEEQT